MRGITAVFLAIAVGSALACAPQVEEDVPYRANSAATVAIFQPDTAEPCLSRMPYPVDLVKDQHTGKIAIPFCPGDPADQVAIKTGLNTLDGWAVTTAIYTDFAGLLDPATLDAGIFLVDLTHGGLVESHGAFDAEVGRLYILPTAPLKEKTRYAVILTDAMLDVDGAAPVGDVIFTLIKSTTPLIDALGYSTSAALSDADANALEPLRLLYDQLFTFVIEKAPLNLTRAETINAWTFTTQTVESQLPNLAAVVDNQAFGAVTLRDASPAATNALLAAAGLPTANLCRIYTGQIALRNLLDASGMLGPAFATTATEDQVDYLLLTPRGSSTTCTTMTDADPWDFTKVVLFVHALGSCRNESLAIADTFASLGFATLSVDGVRAGTRSVTSLGDQNMDECPDQAATPDIIALGGETPNPFGIRDRLWEWGMETMQVAKVAKTSPWVFSGVTAPGVAPATTVAVFGHSWGGMAAILGGAVSPDIDLLAVNATSADLTAMFEPLLAAGLADQLAAAGVDLSSSAGKAQLAALLQQTMGAFGWALEPADPRFAVNLYPKTVGGDRVMPVLVQVVTSGNQELQADAPMHAAATQDELVEAFGLSVADSTFELACVAGGVNQPICDDSTGVVAAVMQPCVADTTSALYPIAMAKLLALRTQLVTFIASNGAVLAATDAPIDCP